MVIFPTALTRIGPRAIKANTIRRWFLGMAHQIKEGNSFLVLLGVETQLDPT